MQGKNFRVYSPNRECIGMGCASKKLPTLNNIRVAVEHRCGIEHRRISQRRGGPLYTDLQEHSQTHINTHKYTHKHTHASTHTRTGVEWATKEADTRAPGGEQSLSIVTCFFAFSSIANLGQVCRRGTKFNAQT